MKPRAFLELARELSGRKEDEAAWRSAVSRGYYALFNAMAIFLADEKVGRLRGTADDHEWVYRYFNNCGLPEMATVASSLNDLRADRNECDYKLSSTRFANPFTVTLAFKKATIAFESFEKSTSGGNKRRIVDGIKRYIARVEG